MVNMNSWSNYHFLLLLFPFVWCSVQLGKTNILKTVPLEVQNNLIQILYIFTIWQKSQLDKIRLRKKENKNKNNMHYEIQANKFVLWKVTFCWLIALWYSSFIIHCHSVYIIRTLVVIAIVVYDRKSWCYKLWSTLYLCNIRVLTWENQSDQHLCCLLPR